MNRAIADYTYLYEYLMDKGVEHMTFESVSNAIQKKFPKTDHLSIGTMLTILLRSGDFPGVIQKMCGYYILFDLFRSDGQTESPFGVFLISAYELTAINVSKVCIIERNFLGKLLANGSKEFAKQTPSHILQQDVVPLQVDLTAYQAIINERQSEIPITVRRGLMNLLSGANTTATDNSIKELMEGMTKLNTPLRNSFSPQMMTIAPPLLPVDDELIWFDFTNPAWHKPMYDHTYNPPPGCNVSLEAIRLMEQAFKEALNIQDRKTLIGELEKDPYMVYNIGLTPQKLPDLVENNPLVAIEILLKLMHSPQITDYFNVLVNMEMSLYSMEVVNRLTTSVDLPTEFVYLYISNCISTCETIKDKYVQTRLVRLLCVFLQSLIRNKIINVRELFLEVEAFCVEFSRIREAVGLYRLLKQLELTETNGSGGQNNGSSTTTNGAGTSSSSNTTSAKSKE